MGLRQVKFRPESVSLEWSQVGSQAPRAWSRKGRGTGEPWGEEEGLRLPDSVRENGEESGVVAQSLKVLPNPVPPGTHELGGLLCQQTSWDAVLLSQLLKTGPLIGLGVERTCWGFQVRIR